MKRNGDDLPSGSQSEEPQLTKTSHEKTKEDAAAFMKEARETLQNEKEKLDMLLDVMNDNNAQRIGAATFTARVQDIIKGHNNLMDGFDAFLPVGHENYLRGYVYCEKVEERLASKDEFQKFTSILYSMALDATIRKQTYLLAMNGILGNHQDLMDEFNELLENGYMSKFLIKISSHRAL